RARRSRAASMQLRRARCAWYVRGYQMIASPCPAPRGNLPGPQTQSVIERKFLRVDQGPDQVLERPPGDGFLVVLLVGLGEHLLEVTLGGGHLARVGLAAEGEVIQRRNLLLVADG